MCIRGFCVCVCVGKTLILCERERERVSQPSENVCTSHTIADKRNTLSPHYPHVYFTDNGGDSSSGDGDDDDDDGDDFAKAQALRTGNNTCTEERVLHNTWVAAAAAASCEFLFR